VVVDPAHADGRQDLLVEVFRRVAADSVLQERDRFDDDERGRPEEPATP
jgi:hypothetical protein